MFRSAPADIMKTLKEQNVTLNNHIKCIPVEVGTRQTCFMTEYCTGKLLT